MTDFHAVLPAVVLAGAPAEPEWKARYSVAYRAEVLIAGKAMAQHVIDALNASSHVGDVCLVGNIQCEGASKIVPPVGSFMDNLVAGVKASEAGVNGRILVATSDIPLVTPEAVDDFISRCVALDADFCYPIISKEASERKFPSMRRTYGRLAEGTFTGGNIVVMNARFPIENAALIREVLDARKSVMRLARVIGLRTLVRAVIAQTLWAKAVDLAFLEKTVGRILNAKVKAVATSYPEIGADVDDLEQIALVEAAFGKG
ncbi:MAG TPA: NTP transferase domain-containing protein [Armatimonadota bacterium]|nr:NTP transferase domain-containing protein [Armatimonadota bacterium]